MLDIIDMMNRLDRLLQRRVALGDRGQNLGIGAEARRLEDGYYSENGACRGA